MDVVVVVVVVRHFIKWSSLWILNGEFELAK